MAVSRVLRGVLLAGVCLTTVAAVWRLCRPPLAALRDGVVDGPAGLEDLVVAGSAVMLLLCVAWLVATIGLELTAALLDEVAPRAGAAGLVRRLGHRWTPRVTRRLVGLVLGLAVGAAAAPPVWADDGVAGLPLPDRTSGAVAATHAPRVGPLAPPTEVVVRSGDSLWSIAAGLLDPDAGDPEVTRAWHRLHRANADRVADPDLIHPGTRLVVPGSLAAQGKEPQ